MKKPTTVFVTGGAGFIGSAVVGELLKFTEFSVINIDSLTYAGNPVTIARFEDNSRYQFVQADICDAKAMDNLFMKNRPAAVMHLAAESHVDRSIGGSSVFVQTNIVGTYTLLETARHLVESSRPESDGFLFHHVSTDEVYGSLGHDGLFTENSPYAPNSPYSASKAASDHLVRAWGETYGLQTVISNCSNNYGPYQYPEKLIPVVIGKALAEQAIPVYGSGENVRDWLFVDDHARALVKILREGTPGRAYNVGGNSEKTNIEVVRTICRVLDELVPRKGNKRYEELILFVSDRPGHDFRYAIDSTRIRCELGWQPRETFDSGIRQTVDWYLSSVGRSWVEEVEKKQNT
jgi:dTDP-glucose 4,6-dehydratase